MFSKETTFLFRLTSWTSPWTTSEENCEFSQRCIYWQTLSLHKIIQHQADTEEGFQVRKQVFQAAEEGENCDCHGDGDDNIKDNVAYMVTTKMTTIEI